MFEEEYASSKKEKDFHALPSHPQHGPLVGTITRNRGTNIHISSHHTLHLHRFRHSRLLSINLPFRLSLRLSRSRMVPAVLVVPVEGSTMARGLSLVKVIRAT